MSSGEFCIGEAFLSSEMWGKAAFFEDDGETAYFYACEKIEEDPKIIDALHIYNVNSVVDGDKPSLIEIMWAPEGIKTGLFINGVCHAIFDFDKMEGMCRSNFPDSEYRVPWKEEA